MSILVYAEFWKTSTDRLNVSESGFVNLPNLQVVPEMKAVLGTVPSDLAIC